MVPIPLLFVRLLLRQDLLQIQVLYSTTYIGQVLAHEIGKEPDRDVAAQRGELAMLLYSVGAFVGLPQ